MPQAFGFAPELWLIEVLYGYLAFFKAIEQVSAQRGRKIGPLNLRHDSCAEGHASQFFLEFFALGGFGGLREAIGESEKAPFFSFFGGEAGLDQVDQNAVGAGLFCLGEGLDPPGNPRWQRNALADGLVCIGHEAFYTRLHHNASAQCNTAKSCRALELV